MNERKVYTREYRRGLHDREYHSPGWRVQSL